MRIYILLFAIIILTATSFGCSDSEVEKAANQKIEEINSLLKEKNADLEKVKAENIKLSAKNSELQNDFDRLKIEYDSLSVSYDELDTWSKKLADGYGTGIWYMDESDRPVFVKSIKQADITAIIEELNKIFHKENLPEIILDKIENKTAYIGVDDDELLTQRMGSFGARAYIRAVTYSITSIKDIDCIWLEIKLGDHAVPGEYCK